MAAEMIEKIVEAENQCAQRLKDAGLQADSIVASAHCEAERILTQAKSDAAFAMDKTLEKAQNDGKAFFEKKCSKHSHAKTYSTNAAYVNTYHLFGNNTTPNTPAAAETSIPSFHPLCQVVTPPKKAAAARQNNEQFSNTQDKYNNTSMAAVIIPP